MTTQRHEKRVRVSFSFSEARRIFNARFAVVWASVVLDGEVIAGDQAETALDLANEIPGVDVEEVQ